VPNNITITYQAKPTVPAFCTPQCFAVMSWGGGPLVTNMLMNCTGVLVHAPQQQVSALAHVESRPTVTSYGDDFKRAMQTVRDKIAARGAAGALEVVLCGNFQGTAELSREFESALFGTFHQGGLTLARDAVVDYRGAPLAQVDRAGHPHNQAVHIAGTALFEPSVGVGGTLSLSGSAYTAKDIGWFDKGEQFRIQ
jgi:hypothetical protein